MHDTGVDYTVRHAALKPFLKPLLKPHSHPFNSGLIVISKLELHQLKCSICLTGVFWCFHLQPVTKCIAMHVNLYPWIIVGREFQACVVCRIRWTANFLVACLPRMACCSPILASSLFVTSCLMPVETVLFRPL